MADRRTAMRYLVIIERAESNYGAYSTRSSRLRRHWRHGRGGRAEHAGCDRVPPGGDAPPRRPHSGAKHLVDLR